MQHNFSAEGFGVRVRPVRMEDAEFIFWLRNLDYAKGRIGDSMTEIVDQRKWLEAYFEREGDYYFIVETTKGVSVGTYGIYDAKDGSAEGGRWIVRKDSMAAVSGAILTNDLAFGDLKLSELRGRTVASNQAVLSINERFGMQKVRVETEGQIIGGQSVDIVHYILTPDNWLKARAQIVPIAQQAENLIRNWELVELGKEPVWFTLPPG